jgi:hypothetical protein
MDDPTPQDPTMHPPTDPTEPVAVVDETDPTASDSTAAPTATPGRRRFLNRTTGALVAAGLLGAVLGGGAVAVAGGVADGGGDHHEVEHRDDARGGPGRMDDGPWGSRDGRSFGPGGGMMRGGPRGGNWGGGQQPPQGGQQQFGPQGGTMQGGPPGGWGPQGMTRGS